MRKLIDGHCGVHWHRPSMSFVSSIALEGSVTVENEIRVMTYNRKTKSSTRSDDGVMTLVWVHQASIRVPAQGGNLPDLVTRHLRDYQLGCSTVRSTGTIQLPLEVNSILPVGIESIDETRGKGCEEESECWD